MRLPIPPASVDAATDAEWLHGGTLAGFARDMGVAIVIILLVWLGTVAWDWWQQRSDR